jgi:hypothetical protein
MVIGKVFPVEYGFPKLVPLKLLPLLLAGVDVFEIIVLLSAVNLVVVAPAGAAILVLFISFAVVFAVAGLAVVFAVAGLAVVFAVAGLAVVFAVAGLAVVLTGNLLELMEEKFRTFAALVNVARRIIKAIDTTTTAINGI